MDREDFCFLKRFQFGQRIHFYCTALAVERQTHLQLFYFRLSCSLNMPYSTREWADSGYLIRFMKSSLNGTCVSAKKTNSNRSQLIRKQAISLNFFR